MSYDILLSAVALMFIFEGLAPLLFPNRWQSFMLKLANEPTSQIRQIGLLLVGLGAIIMLWLYG
ncbi:DUF2065 domain-containing protein [Thalassotalea ponticola]|uniref:DUF2065 domain-containing protein n=2 Tax=Thalassotalea ponticola TaxID=1523392 RepID=UPI0025B2B20B|nr:DUF2065 domain-containing protein [Thalassotalea ponticola]MDN3652869.1 DUF2065 domain-containing protein [Thalassotalea ponticola]